MSARIDLHDWAATPLGPAAGWPVALRTLVQIMLGANQPMFVAWGDDRTLLYNDAYAEILAAKHPDALGRDFLAVWEEIRADLAPIVSRAYGGDPVHMDHIELLMRRRGYPEETHFAFSYTPVRGETGAVAGIFCACTEITGQVTAERRRREAEAALRVERDRTRRVLDGMAEAFGLLDREFRVVDINAEGLRLEGRPREAILGKTHWEAWPGSEDGELGRLYKRAMAERVPVGLEHRHVWPDGRAAWLEMRAYPTDDGLALFWRDVTGRRLADEALRASEARFRLMADAVPQIVWITDAQGNAEFFNRRWRDYTGASEPPTNAGDVAANFLHPDDAAATMAAFDEARRSGGTFRVEHRIRSSTGEYRWFLVRGEPERDPRTGESVRWFGASVDIHDRRVAEEALRQREARLRFIGELDEAMRATDDATAAMLAAATFLARRLDVSRCAYADVDADSDRFTIRSDYTAEGVASSVGTYSLDLFGPRAAADMRGGRTLVVADVPGELPPGEGREMFLAIGIGAIVCCPLVKDGRLVAMMAVHHDVPRAWRDEEIALVETVVERCWAHVERVAAEARQRESEARYRTLFEAIDAGFCVVDMILDEEGRPVDYRFVEANPAFERQSGLRDPIGRTVRELAPDLEPHWFEIYGRVALTGEAVRFENGSEALGRWFDVHALRVGAPQDRRVAILFNDISERRRAEERLRELNDTLEIQVAERTAERDRMWNTSPDLMLVIDFDGYFRRVNPAWTTLLGYTADELVGHHVNEFVIPDDHAPTVEAYELAAEGGRPAIENRYRHKDGSTRWISWVAAPAGGVTYATGRDVTAVKARQAELEAAQEALRQSQKMEAMGQLTGGVAHDFNNLLTPIIGSLDLLTRRGIGSERERRLIDGALQSAERAKTLVQRLLAFARRQPLQPVAVDLGAMVDGMAGLIGSTIGPRIDMRLEVEPGLPPAIADPNQLEMALLNLAVNARDAMPDGGVMTIRASRGSVREARAGLRPGAYVRLSVSDTGSGMDEATRARAIEPFFSTKGIGRGTGLGLSMVHGLTAQLGGGLTLESAPGQGTVVEMWLPVSLAPVEADGPDQAGPKPGPARGRALVVDDEDLVRMTTADMLADLGYEVTEAGSAEEALRLLRGGLAPHVLVTDHLMPGMSGVELARHAGSLRPGLPVLIVSGYAEVGGIAPDIPRLTKPFRNADLARSLAALVPADGSGEAPAG